MEDLIVDVKQYESEHLKALILDSLDELASRQEIQIMKEDILVLADIFRATE